MKRPHIVYDKPPSAGSHGLRRTSALAAFRRVRAFLERATDCAGARGVDIRYPNPIDPAVRGRFPAGEWQDGRDTSWSGGHRQRPGDPQTVIAFDELEAVIEKLASEPPFEATVAFDYLHVDPRTGALLPYEEADFDASPEPWSRALLFLVEGGSNQVSPVMRFPYAEIGDEIVAIHDAAFETMAITLSPAYWLRHLPPKKRGHGVRKKIPFDRNARVAPAADDEAPFLTEIASDLDDDAPRQVYADVLLAKGDPRGTFINVQCELARLPEESPRRGELEALERKLLREHGKRWSRVPAKLRATLRRGFVEEVRVVFADDYTRQIEALYAIAPTVRALEVEAAVGEDDVEALIRACARLPLRELALRPFPTCLEQLARGGVLSPLRRLGVVSRTEDVTRELLHVTCEQVGLPELTTLELGGLAIDVASVERIAASSRLPRLARMVLDGTSVRAVEAPALEARLNATRPSGHVSLALHVLD